MGRFARIVRARGRSWSWGREWPFIAQGEKLPPYSLLSNIINNALKASPAGGTVKIGLHEEERKCRILVRSDGAILQTIRDRFF